MLEVYIILSFFFTKSGNGISKIPRNRSKIVRILFCAYFVLVETRRKSKFGNFMLEVYIILSFFYKIWKRNFQNSTKSVKNCAHFILRIFFVDKETEWKFEFTVDILFKENLWHLHYKFIHIYKIYTLFYNFYKVCKRSLQNSRKSVNIWNIRFPPRKFKNFRLKYGFVYKMVLINV